MQQVTAGFAKWGVLWSVLIMKFDLVVEIKGVEWGGSCGGVGEGRDDAGIGVETWGKQINGKELV